MPGKVLEAKTFVSVLLFVSVLYCPYGSAFPLGVMLGLVLSKRVIWSVIGVDRIKRKGIRLRAWSPCVIPFYSDNGLDVKQFLFLLTVTR